MLTRFFHRRWRHDGLSDVPAVQPHFQTIIHITRKEQNVCNSSNVFMDICHCEELNSELTQSCSRRGYHLRNKSATSSCSELSETGLSKNRLFTKKISFFCAPFRRSLELRLTRLGYRNGLFNLYINPPPHPPVREARRPRMISCTNTWERGKVLWLLPRAGHCEHAMLPVAVYYELSWHCQLSLGQGEFRFKFL